jgi:hypothetical protein
LFAITHHQELVGEHSNNSWTQGVPVGKNSIFSLCAGDEGDKSFHN